MKMYAWFPYKIKFVHPKKFFKKGSDMKKESFDPMHRPWEIVKEFHVMLALQKKEMMKTK